MVARTIAVPPLVAVKDIPSNLIFPPVVPASATLQVMVLLVAFAGSTVPFRFRIVYVIEEPGMPVIFVTGTKEVTVIVKSCV